MCNKKFALRLLAVLLVISIIPQCKKKSAEQLIVITALAGEVHLKREPLKTISSLTDVIQAGDTIVTGDNSFIELALGRESGIRIYQKSEFTLTNIKAGPDGFSDSVMSLNVGKILFTLKKILKNNTVRINTPVTVVSVRGTDFVVSIRDDKKGMVTDLSVIRGKVEIASIAKPEVADVVNDAQTVSLSKDSIVVPKTAIVPEELKILEGEVSSVIKNVENIRRGDPKNKNTKPEAAPALKSEKEIRTYYNKLERVSLDDGTILVGAVIEQNAGKVRIHTVSGIIEVPQASIVEIKMINK